MSLVVAGVDDGPSARLRDQLIQLGFSVLPARDLQVVMTICEHSLPDLVILDDLEQGRAMTEQHPRLSVVLATDRPPDPGTLLEALRVGFSDVWPVPMEDAAVSERLSDIRRRRAAMASDAERQLSQMVAELERDQHAGRYIQMRMLPPNPMAIDGFRLAHRVLPSLILSGDFVDYFRITDRHFAFYVADVSGHGASSAFVTVLLKNFSRRLRREYRPSMLVEPGEILAWINRELLEQKIDKFVALLMGVGDLETQEIRLVNGGHYPPAILVGRGESEFVEQRGKPVGLFEEVSYDARTIRLDIGDRLVMFSDGVLDAMADGDLTMKEQRLLQAAGESDGIDAVCERLGMNFGVSNKPDDMTCLLVQRES